MKIQYRILLAGLSAAMLLSSCNIYRNYSRPDEVTTAGMYRDTLSAADTLRGDTTSMGNLPWQEVFRDPYLQSLIAQGLEHNLDLQTARLRVQEAEASLQAARLSYVPSFNLNPNGALSWYENGRRQWTYQVPAAASGEVNLFGRLLNSKRGARAALMQSEAYAQAVRTQVIASIANTYYTLQMLNQQLAISEQTVISWRKSVETMKALKLAGSVNEAAGYRARRTAMRSRLPCPICGRMSVRSKTRCRTCWVSLRSRLSVPECWPTSRFRRPFRPAYPCKC